VDGDLGGAVEDDVEGQSPLPLLGDLVAGLVRGGPRRVDQLPELTVREPGEDRHCREVRSQVLGVLGHGVLPDGGRSITRQTEGASRCNG
jgi:hypothetical protein